MTFTDFYEDDIVTVTEVVYRTQTVSVIFLLSTFLSQLTC